MKAGLEIHQQLNTKTKLFCSCPTILSEKVSKRIKRRLKAIAGETGEIDIAAKYEEFKAKEYIYEYDPSYACLVELDEEPPHLINMDALKLSITLSEFFEMYIPRVLQVMRKTVVDGSNTSGFQRTLLVGLDGKIKIKGKEYTIQSLCLEEDAARKIKEDENSITYRLDRLGIPLIEIATGPDIKDPKEAREVAEYIGLVLRLTGKVKRGLGTIRQDLNISIEGGEKIEIKGVQDLKLIDKVLELEVLRQKKLLEWQGEVKRRRIDKVEFEIKDITKLFEDTNSKIIKNALKSGGKVYGIKLNKMKGLIGFELVPGRRIGTELADVAKRYGLKGILHSDELPNYGITESDVEKIKLELKCSDSDAFILITGPEEKLKKVCKAIIERLNEMIKKVPKDTRKVNPDGTTSYLRPQPGSARMYPETDLPLIFLEKEIKEFEDYILIEYKITHGHIDEKLKIIKLKKRDIGLVNKLKEKCDYILDLWDPEFRTKILESYGLPKKIIEDLIWSEKLEIFENLVRKFKVKPTTIYYVLEQIKGDLKRKGIEKYEISLNVIEKLLKLLEDGKIVKDALPDILEVVIKEKLDVERAVDKLGYWKITGEKLEEELKKFIAKLDERDYNKVIKIVMSNFRCKAEPKEIISIVQKLLKNDSKN